MRHQSYWVFPDLLYIMAALKSIKCFFIIQTTRKFLVENYTNQKLTGSDFCCDDRCKWRICVLFQRQYDTLCKCICMNCIVLNSFQAKTSLSKNHVLFTAVRLSRPKRGQIFCYKAYISQNNFNSGSALSSLSLPAGHGMHWKRPGVLMQPTCGFLEQGYAPVVHSSTSSVQAGSAPALCQPASQIHRYFACGRRTTQTT